MQRHNTRSVAKLSAGVALAASLLFGCNHGPAPANSILTDNTAVPASGITPEPSQSGQFLAARQALYNQDVAAAGLFFDRTVPDNVDNLMLLEQSFLSHYQSGNLDRAEDIAVRLEQLGSQLGLSVEPALAAAVRGEDWQAVIALSEKMAQTDNGYILSAGLRSLAYIGLNEPETALQEQQLLADFITDSQADIPVSFVLLQKAYLAEVSGQAEEAVLFYRQAGRQDDPSTYMKLAVTSGLWRLGRTEEALAGLADYDDNDLNLSRLALLFRTGQMPSAQKLSLKQVIGRFIFEFSWFSRLSGSQALVLPRLHLALSIWPELHLAHLILAQTFADGSAYDRALFHLDQIDKTSHYFLQAIMLRMQITQQTETAGAAFAVMDAALNKLSADTPAVDLTQDQAALYRYAGGLARREGLHQDAIDYFERALTLGAETNFIYRNLGISYEQLDQTQKAEQAFLKALALNPDDATTLNYIGYWWADENRRLDEALSFIKRAVELRPSSGYFADSLGWVYFRLGRYDEAVAWLEKAIQLAPTDPLISDHLGDAYWQVGRRLEAQYKWRQALDMGIDVKFADQIEKKIANGLD